MSLRGLNSPLGNSLYTFSWIKHNIPKVTNKEVALLGRKVAPRGWVGIKLTMITHDESAL